MNVVLKVLFVSPAGNAYGSECSMLNAMPRAREFQAEVACPPNGSLVEKLVHLGIRSHPMEFGRYAFSRRPDWHIGFYLRFRRLLINSRPDVLVINLDGNTPLVTLAAIRSGIPIVRFSRFEFTPPHRWIDKYCWLKSAAVICPSEMVREQVLRWAPAAFRSRVHRWYDPIDVPSICADQGEMLRAELKLSRGKVVGFVGRLDSRKGIETALHAISIIRNEYPDIRLLLVGDHDGTSAGVQYARSLKTLTCKLGLEESVSFLGYRKDVSTLLSLFDVCLLPSESESFGMVLAESWSVGTPTVASDVGGCREITLASGGGLLSPVGNANELAQRTLDFLQDPHLAQSVGAAGQAWVRTNCDPVSYLVRFHNLLGTL